MRKTGLVQLRVEPTVLLPIQALLRKHPILCKASLIRRAIVVGLDAISKDPTLLYGSRA